MANVEHSTFTGDELHQPFKYGNLSERPATPAKGDFYWATDEDIIYKCLVAGTWTQFSAGWESNNEQAVEIIKPSGADTNVIIGGSGAITNGKGILMMIPNTAPTALDGGAAMYAKNVTGQSSNLLLHLNGADAATTTTDASRGIAVTAAALLVAIARRTATVCGAEERNEV